MANETFHLAGWLESVDPAGAFVQLAALADQQITVQTPAIRVPAVNQVIAVAAGIEIVAESFARLSSPSLRVRGTFAIEPFNTATAGAVEPATPAVVCDLRRIPLPLVRNENLVAEINSNPAAAQIQWVLVWFAAGPVAPVEGGIFTVRATNATTLVAGAWTNGVLTFTEDLPRGRYQVVGMRARSAGLVAARLVFPGGIWRPGVLGTDAQSDLEHPMFRYGGLGAFGDFEDIEAPTVDFLSVSADTAQDVYLDLIQTRAGEG
jgi:hypothetical protein